MGSRLCNSVHRHQQNISDYLVSTVCQVYWAPTYSDELMTSTNLILVKSNYWSILWLHVTSPKIKLRNYRFF